MVLFNIRSYWRQQSSSPQLPKWRQILEMAALYLFRGIGPGYYIQGRWGRANVPFADKWLHMNRSEYRRFINHWNSPDYHKLSQHKLVEKSIISLSGLPSPAYIGFAHHERGRDPAHNPVRSASDLEKLLRGLHDRRVCFKRVEGYGGKGFQGYRIQVSDAGVSMIHPITEAVMSPEQWWREYGSDADGFLIEHHQPQHPELARLNPSSLNTVRLWVCDTPRGSEVLGGYLRIGRPTSLVDNNSSGGMAGVLDVAAGKVLGVYDPAASMQPVQLKSASGGATQSIDLPYWDRVTRLAKDALKLFPHMNVVGLDIGFGPDGPTLIELNVIPDYIGCAWMGLPLKTVDRHMRGQ